jgi:flagellar M-ring protein FliF
MSLRDQMEKEMVAKAAAILEPIFGRKNVQVNASVEIETNAVEQTEELFNPNPQAVVSHQRSEERAGGNIFDAGIPGTQSNVGLVSSPPDSYCGVAT